MSPDGLGVAGVEVETGREREEALRNGVMINMTRREPLAKNSPRIITSGGKRRGDPVKMKKLNTGFERAEKTVIRAIPEIETVEVVREMKVWRGIIETEIVEV